MTKRELASLACKVLAIWILAKGVAHLGNIVAILVGMIEGTIGYGAWGSAGYIAGFTLTMVTMLLPGLVTVVFALIVWKKADSLAGRMVGPDDGQPVSYDVSGEGLLTIAIVAIGVALVVFAIPDIVGAAWAWFAWSDASPWPRNPGPLFRASAKLIMGLWLIVGTRRIVRVLAKVRTIGLDKGSAEQSESHHDQKEADG